MRIPQGEKVRFVKQPCPEDLGTGGMAPCVGVIAFDASSGVAHGTHLTDPSDQELKTLQAMLSAATQEFTGSISVTVFMSGCCLGNPGAVATRRFVEREVRKAFPNATIEAKWPGSGVDMVEMILNLEDGTVDIVEARYPANWISWRRGALSRLNGGGRLPPKGT